MLGTRTLVLALAFSLGGPAGGKEKPVVIDPAQADADFKVQGEYRGERVRDGKSEKLGVQVIARGGGSFEMVRFEGGLPGDRGERKSTARVRGKTEGDRTTFAGPGETAVIRGDALTITGPDGKIELQRVVRKSETLGQKPPPGAVVLFDGTSSGEWEGKGKTPEGLLLEGNKTREKFQSCSLHLEFLLPYMPESSGQERGNSGTYLQGRYEAQILDSFGLEGRDNECGGIYSVGAPLVNMCFPPLSWQTYDIDFTAAGFDASGKKVKNARMTVRHNGVLVQKDREIDHATTAAIEGESPRPGPVYLQDHGCPVRFRNIWILKKD